jgi:predicted methyltransferase
MIMKYYGLLLSALVLAGTAHADAETDAKISAAMTAEARPQADRDRDENRLPLETLNFFGLEGDMHVLELLPGGGWYTRILAPMLAANGQLYVAIGTGNVRDNLLDQPGFTDVEVIEAGDNLRRDDDIGAYVLDTVDFGVDDLDTVLTFRNLHNFDPASREKLNAAVFESLKPGGLYGVVDHTRRHMQQANPENGRRIDPVLVIKEMLDAGFEFEAYSDLHYRPDDELLYEVGRKSVTGNTDRFTLLFRKP